MGDEKVSIGMKEDELGLEVMVTFDPMMYEPADVTELEAMFLSVLNRWWKGRAFKYERPGVFSTAVN